MTEAKNFMIGYQTPLFLRRNFFAKKHQEQSEATSKVTFHAPTLVSNWLCAHQTKRRNEREELANAVKESNGTKSMLTIFDRQTGIPSDLETLSEDEIGNLHVYSFSHFPEEERLADEATTARFAEKIRLLV